MAKFKEALRRVVPRQLLVWVKIYYIYQCLWKHTPEKGTFIQNADHEHLPWITYGAIEFLNHLDFSDALVFEYGSGSSTFYWGAKAKNVYSVERDRPWFEKINPIIPKNCTLVHESDERNYPGRISEFHATFDVIVIDGAVRYPCMEAALPFLKPKGIFILDNLEWYPETAKRLREQGFFQIDFSGLTPQNAFTSCTSVFFRDPEFLKKRKEIPEWKPVGGRYLFAYDDKPLQLIHPSVLVR